MPKLSNKKMEEKRAYILSVAFELFAQKGYTATGMRDIMQATNISKGGIYVHFDSKSAILQALVKQFDDARHGLRDELDLEAPIEEVFASYLSKRLKVFKEEKNQKWSRIALEFWSLPQEVYNPTGLDKEERYKAYYNDIKELIERGITLGVFSKTVNVDSVVYQIMSTINGTGVLSGIMGNVITDVQIEETIKMYLTYLKGA